jgi:hypothetical protein
MDMARFKTFPFIAAAIVLSAALLGLALGGLTAVDSPKASGVPPEPAPRWSPPPENTPRDPGPVRPIPAPLPMPVETPGPKLRVLEPGRVDEMIVLERNEKADSSIVLTMEDEQGNRLMPSSITLAIDTPGVGWQYVPGAGQPIGEGRVHYPNLFPGRYRVRCENPIYAPVEEVLSLGATEVNRHVRLVVQSAQRAQAVFLVRLPDNTVPQYVTVQIIRGEGSRPGLAGRFEAQSAINSRAGMLESTTGRYTPEKADGSVPMLIAAGRTTKFVFASSVEGRHYGAEVSVTGQPGEQRLDVLLAEGDIGKTMIGDGEPRRSARLEAQFTVNGKAARITSADLRQQLGDRAARQSSRSDGEVFVWENILSGRWWLSAWSKDFHSVYTVQVDVGANERQSFDVRTGHLRINVGLEEGMPESSAKMGYEVRVTPKGFAIERGYRGEFEKASEYLDVFVPQGQYDVRVQSTGGVKLVFDPGELETEVSTEGTQNVNFVAMARTAPDCGSMTMIIPDLARA